MTQNFPPGPVPFSAFLSTGEKQGSSGQEECTEHEQKDLGFFFALKVFYHL